MKIMLSLAFMAVAAASFGQCCGDKKTSADEAFMKVAAEMTAKAEGKKACCQSTAAKPVAKGEKGCCNAKEAPKPFKVYVAGEGYKFFGCEGSAGEGRKELMAKGAKVGPVQKANKA